MSHQGSYDKQWGADDFDRYHSGAMPDSERHSLEKAALEDPFLADALEGYALASAPSQSLIELHSRLDKRKKKRRTLWAPGQGFSQVLKIAAILIVFVGVAWLLQKNINKTDNKVSIADRKVPPSVLRADTLQNTRQADTSINTMEKAAPLSPVPIVISPPQPGAALPSNSDFQTDTIRQEVARTTDAKDDAAIENIELFSREKKEASSTQNNQALQGKVSGMNIRNQNAIRGRVVDEAGLPVAFASVHDAQNKILLSADSEGYFMLNNQKNVTNVNVDVNAAGYEKNKAALSQSNAENTVVLQKSEAALSEVVVSGYGTRRKSERVAGAPVTSSPAGHRIINVKFTNVSPVNGWPNMQRFILDSVQRQPVYKALLSNRKQLTISFDLDSSGRAIQLRPAYSLADSSARTVTRFLQTLPSLKKIKPSKTSSITLRY